MFTTAHLTSGVVVGLALGLDGWPLALLVLASVFTDWDFAFQLLTGRNHRTFLTHCPLVMGAVLLALTLGWPWLWPLLMGNQLHYLLDVWEYGLRLNPFSTKVYGLRLLPGVENMRFGDYLRTYFGDRRFLGAEIALAAAAAALAAWRWLA